MPVPVHGGRLRVSLRLALVSLGTGCALQDAGANAVGVAGAHVDELDVRVLAGDADLDLRGTDDAGDERALDVDVLHAVEPRLAALAEEHSALQLDGGVGDSELREAPGEVAE